MSLGCSPVTLRTQSTYHNLKGVLINRRMPMTLLSKGWMTLHCGWITVRGSFGTIVCAASLESTPDSLTQGCKVQECKQQVMSYKLLFLGTCVLFLNTCLINNSMPAFQHLHVNCDRLTRLRTQNNSLARQSTQTNLHGEVQSTQLPCQCKCINVNASTLFINSLHPHLKSLASLNA